ncbi:hypothetical protein TNCV_1048661 [Trichonephila clavipes]|nr:hypothetical protein TNCV_1048661 [Trichonephila clavipes]
MLHSQMPHQINFGNAWKLLGLLYPTNTSKVSLNQCRGVWQRGSPTMVATLATDSEGLFGLGALGKIKFLVQLSIVRAQVPPSGEETRSQNYLPRLVYHLHDAALKRDTNPTGNELGLMHVKPVEARSRPVGKVWKLGEQSADLDAVFLV